MTTATLAPPQTSLVNDLRKQTAAVRLMHGKFGVRRSLSKVQVKEAAEAFGASGDFLSAGKKLINTRNVHWMGCTRTISRARAHWRQITVPYPIPGIRLLRKDLVPSFDQAMNGFRDELKSAAKSLQQEYQSLRTEAQERLGTLFSAMDYPASIEELFLVAWDYPSVDPPDYLKQLNPALYEAEQQKVAARFEQAIQLAEDAFAAELQRLVAHLAERLSGEEDGKPKKFRDSAIENLNEFFKRFEEMNVGSNAQLSALVEQAENLVANVDPKDLRKDIGFRAQLAGQLDGVKTMLDALVVEKPTRAISLEDE